MKRIAVLTILSLTTVLAVANKKYDFRTSDAYRQLSAVDRERLEQVRRDHVLLWGALEMYCDEHNDNSPTTLDELVPKYLAELPSDPFRSSGGTLVELRQRRGPLDLLCCRGDAEKARRPAFRTN